jgi:hypothetical protein
MLSLLTALPDLKSRAKPHWLTLQHQRVRTLIRITPEHVFVGDANYMRNPELLSRQKRFIQRKNRLISLVNRVLFPSEPRDPATNYMIMLNLHTSEGRMNRFTKLFAP